MKLYRTSQKNFGSALPSVRPSCDRCLIAAVLVALLITVFPSIAYCGVYQTFYVSPSGNDGDGKSLATAKKTIQAAQTLVRQYNTAAGMTGDIEVQIDTGTYYCGTYPFDFTNADSGQNGYRVIWRARTPSAGVYYYPVLSAGKLVTGGWTLISGTTYQSNTQYAPRARQLYVDNVRCDMSSKPMVAQDAYVNATSKYIEISGELPPYWSGAPVEVVILSQWMEYITQIASSTYYSSTDKTRIFPTLDSAPFWTKFDNQKHTYYLQGGNWLESNSFYHSGGNISFNNGLGGNMSTKTVIIPGAESVLYIHGSSPSTPVRDLVFHGLHFSHTSYNAPSTPSVGYMSHQAGATRNPDYTTSWVPGGVQMINATEVDIQGCVFTRMGGFGLDINRGTTNCRIVGNYFTDISGGGIRLGTNLQYYTGTDKNSGILISDNLIDECGMDYYDHAGIVMAHGYATNIMFNEVRYMPYVGISIGWGWGTPAGLAYPIQYNYCGMNEVHHVAEFLRDTSGIYTLDNHSDAGSYATGTHITQNYIHDISLNPLSAPGGYNCGIYHDQGSNWISTYNNRLSNIDSSWGGDPWIFTHDPGTYLSIHDNNVNVAYLTSSTTGPRPGFTVYAGNQTYATTRNIAPFCRPGVTTQYSAQYTGRWAIDLSSSTLWCSAHTDPNVYEQYTLDFVRTHRVTKVEIQARQDVDHPEERRNFQVFGWTGPSGTGTSTLLGSQGSTAFLHKGTWSVTPTVGSYASVTVKKTVKTENLSFAEVRVFSDN